MPQVQEKKQVQYRWIGLPTEVYDTIKDRAKRADRTLIATVRQMIEATETDR